jgi:phosphoglucosamine mutase
LNAEVQSKPDLETLPDYVAARLLVEAELGETGRVVVRYSGTEAKVRVMVEGPDLLTVRRHAEHLLNVLKTSITA